MAVKRVRSPRNKVPVLSPTRPKSIDWERVEREYRAGQLTIGEISTNFNVSRVSIAKHAKEGGWTRDLSEQVRKGVSARLVNDGELPFKDAIEPRELIGNTAQEVVESAVDRGVKVVQAHRQDIRSLRIIALNLVRELDEASQNREGIAEEIERETAGDENGKRRAAMHRAVSLGARANIAASLSVVIKNVITLERQAYNIDAEGEPARRGGDVTNITQINVQMTPQEAETHYLDLIRNTEP